jgi:hypothetical protein
VLKPRDHDPPANADLPVLVAETERESAPVPCVRNRRVKRLPRPAP